MTPARQRLLLAAAALSVGATRFAFRARVADDYDSIGFIRALDAFDLAKLQPHFPGYPVYIALAKALHTILPDPTLAATTLSSLASALTAAALFTIARSLSGPRAAFTAVAIYGAAWLPWLLGGAALAETVALMFATLAFASLGGDGVNLSTCSRRESNTDPDRRGAGSLSGGRSWVLGGALAIGLMLGTRLSYWPLVVSFWLLLRRPQMLRAAIGMVAGIALWLVPFACVVGPRTLLRLGTTHVKGHFGIWGGSIGTESNVIARGSGFLRGLFYDGLVPSWPLLIALVLLVAAAWRFNRPRIPGRVVLIVVAPYALWALLAQNILAQPRHLLPLVVAACLGIALSVAARTWVAAVTVLIMLCAAVPLAWARAHSEPAAARAARWVANQYQPREVVVIGARSMRFFGLLAPAIVTRERNWLSEVDVEVARLDRLPPEILVTSELEVDADRAPRLGEAVTFCRDPRIDRAQPCLSLKPYRIGFARP